MEDRTIQEINVKNGLTIHHAMIPSKQVPSQKEVDAVLEILDNPANYPVLIHCYHGIGRTDLFVALYRIEYEKWNNRIARDHARLFTEVPPFYNSSFADEKPKGAYLLNYKPRYLEN